MSKRIPCPSDTNGDGDCGQPFCPWCSGIDDGLRVALMTLAVGTWTERTDAADKVARRIEAIEVRQRRQGIHDPGCKAIGQYSSPADCTCWLSEPRLPRPVDHPVKEKT